MVKILSWESKLAHLLLLVLMSFGCNRKMMNQPGQGSQGYFKLHQHLVRLLHQVEQERAYLLAIRRSKLAKMGQDIAKNCPGTIQERGEGVVQFVQVAF